MKEVLDFAMPIAILLLGVAVRSIASMAKEVGEIRISLATIATQVLIHEKRISKIEDKID